MTALRSDKSGLYHLVARTFTHKTQAVAFTESRVDKMPRFIPETVWTVFGLLFGNGNRPLLPSTTIIPVVDVHQTRKRTREEAEGAADTATNEGRPRKVHKIIHSLSSLCGDEDRTPRNLLRSASKIWAASRAKINFTQANEHQSRSTDSVEPDAHKEPKAASPRLKRPSLFYSNGTQKPSSATLAGHVIYKRKPARLRSHMMTDLTKKATNGNRFEELAEKTPMRIPLYAAPFVTKPIKSDPDSIKPESNRQITARTRSEYVPPTEATQNAVVSEINQLVTATAKAQEQTVYQEYEQEHRQRQLERQREQDALRDGAQAARAAKLEQRKKRQEEKDRLAQEKAAKKKRLAKQRHEMEREISEKDFRKTKAAYEAFVEKTLRELSEVQLSDDREDEKELEKKKALSEKIPFMTALSTEAEQKVMAALNTNNMSAILAKSVEGVELSRKDISHLLPSSGYLIPGQEPWLNDEVINAWYANLCDALNTKAGYVKSPTSVPPFVAYNTAWWISVSSRGSKGVSSIQNWSRRKGIKNEKLLKTDMIFFPTNTGAHWTLLAISGKQRTVQYLDSLGGRGPSDRRIQMGMDWLKMELGDKFNELDWDIRNVKSGIQNNCNDCGVFACLNGLALVKGGLGKEDPSKMFGAVDIPLGRRRFVAVLLNGGFTGEFDV